jgi:hypothetical protein
MFDTQESGPLPHCKSEEVYITLYKIAASNFSISRYFKRSPLLSS